MVLGRLKREEEASVSGVLSTGGSDGRASASVSYDTCHVTPPFSTSYTMRQDSFELVVRLGWHTVMP
jgi:hypothetical protein